MIGKLILTHGGLAGELLAAARRIAGELPEFEAVALDWDDGIEEARAHIADALARLDQGDGVLVLTDMFGDTPSNAALSFQRDGRVEVLTGVNLPMVVRLGCMTTGEMSVGELAGWIQSKGRQAICRGGDSECASAPAAVAAEVRRPPE